MSFPLVVTAVPAWGNCRSRLWLLSFPLEETVVPTWGNCRSHLGKLSFLLLGTGVEAEVCCWKKVLKNGRYLSLQLDADVVDSLQAFVRQRIGHFKAVGAGTLDSDASGGSGCLIEAAPTVAYPDSFFVGQD